MDSKNEAAEYGVADEEEHDEAFPSFLPFLIWKLQLGGSGFFQNFLFVAENKMEHAEWLPEISDEELRSPKFSQFQSTLILSILGVAIYYSNRLNLSHTNYRNGMLFLGYVCPNSSSVRVNLW